MIWFFNVPIIFFFFIMEMEKFSLQLNNISKEFLMEIEVIELKAIDFEYISTNVCIQHNKKDSNANLSATKIWIWALTANWKGRLARRDIIRSHHASPQDHQDYIFTAHQEIIKPIFFFFSSTLPSLEFIGTDWKWK